MSPNILLLSIQHKYASMIFDGGKQVELRRVRPRHLDEGDLILVYVTSPKKALVGVLEVEKVVEMIPDQLWQLVKDKAGISHESFQKYYENASIGFAIFLRKTERFDSPIKLERLREKWVDFRPPQCYHYLKERELTLVQSIAQHDILSVSDKPRAERIEILPHY